MIEKITGQIQHYEWGSHNLIAELQGRPPSGRPEAELWFGTHPKAPSLTSSGLSLDKVLGHQLPYLLKILAAAQPLSIQVHPSKDQAQDGFRKEEELGLPLNHPERNYKDPNHKPELIIALTEFNGLAGFREIDTIEQLIRQLQVKRLLELDLRDLRSTVESFLTDDWSNTIDELVASCKTNAKLDNELGEVSRMLLTIHSNFPRDPGILCALLLNSFRLLPGEALLIPTGMLHAYLSGMGVEVMANSDNVLRGGLTSKHIDVPELMKVVMFSPASGKKLHLTGHSYDTPLDDFTVSCWPSPNNAHLILEGPTILVPTSGGLTAGGQDISPGEALFATPEEQHLAVKNEGSFFMVSSTMRKE